MATIMPVSGVKTQTQISRGVNFEGKKEKEFNYSNTMSTTLKAVPVAVLIAMSPLNASSTNNVLNNTNINKIENFTQLADVNDNTTLVHEESPIPRSKFQFYSKSGSKKSIDEVVLRLTGHPFIVKGLTNTTLNLVGDDGLSAGELKFPQLILRPLTDNSLVMGDSNSERCDFVQSFLDGNIQGVKNNNSIPVKNVNRTIRFGTDCELQNVGPDTSWLNEGLKYKEFFGFESGHLDVKTKNGNYRVTVYNRDNNKNDFEVVTIKREGGAEFRVSALRGAQVKLEDFGNKIADLSVGIVEVRKRNSEKTAKIVNAELFEAICELKGDVGFNNAFDTSISSSTISVLNGIVYPKN